MINKIVIIFVLFAVSFIQPNNKPKPKNGAIFGKVAFLEAKNIKSFKIILMSTDKVVNPDSEGYFYINNLKPGKYNLKIQMEDSIDRYAEGINVQSDKISCLGTLYTERALSVGKIEWGIIEYQKKIEPVKYGKIEGYIINEKGKPVPNALITYNNDKCPWDGKSDSTGYFKINKVIPGHYPEISVEYRGKVYMDIKVRLNQISRVKLELPEILKWHLN